MKRLDRNAISRRTALAGYMLPQELHRVETGGVKRAGAPVDAMRMKVE
ncbi:hypothetical protein [Xenophilus azovorans]|nr:hypothetical protein [Xenophilus azovorans]